MAPSSNKRPATENEVVPVNSHPANVPHENASYAETRVPFIGHNHNHNDIVHFVGSGENLNFNAFILFQKICTNSISDWIFLLFFIFH